MAERDEPDRPLWLPPRPPEPEPERPLGPEGFLPPRPPGDAPPAGQWKPSSVPPPATRGSVPPPRPAPWTPPPGVELAGWWSRAGAALLDSVIIAAIALTGLLPLLVVAETVDDGELTVGAVLAVFVMLVLGLAAAVLYAPFVMSRTDGQTLGKMAAGIRVIRISGGPVDFGYAFLREIVVKTLAVGVAGSATVGIANAADILWPLWDDQNRALHDMVVQSRVVRSR
jgi:uncharacterized RDD family membrane protein YckC